MIADTIVIGGGVSGLVAALDLADNRRHVVLFDAAQTLGGSVARGAIGTVEAELGADAFACARPEVPALAARLGLTEAIVSPRVYQAYLRRDGKNVALPPSLMGIPLSIDAIEQILGSDAANEARERDLQPLPDNLPESFGELVRQRLGAAVLNDLVDPVVSGVHASRADTVETASILPGFDRHIRTHGSVIAAANALRGGLGPAGAPVAGFNGGMSTLIDALECQLKANNVSIVTAMPVQTLTQAGSIWTVTTETHRVTAKQVVLALPAAIARNVLQGQSDAIQTIRQSLATFQTTDVTLVALHVSVTGLDTNDVPVGSGVLVAPRQADVRAKAMTHVSAKWHDMHRRIPTGSHLFRLSYGGTEAIPATDSAALTTIAVHDLAALLGVPAAAITVHASRVIAWNGALTRPHIGRMAAVAAIDMALQDVDGLALVGNAYAGNGLAGVVGRARREVSRILVAKPTAS
ncbi:MAG: protoporphyrinogen oxidase [Nitriliruptoraceae bacterium]